MLNADGEGSSETRSVLYLQLILQLFDAFGADLLQGDIQATLAFIDFSLSSPSQRQAPQRQENTPSPKAKGSEEDMPFISAKPAAAKSTVSSLFNVSAESEEHKGSATSVLDNEGLNNDPIKEAAQDEDEGDEEEEELVSTALSLLLSLLESDTALSTETQPMLLVIADKIELLLDSTSDEVRSLAKEAKLVLMARRNAHRGPAPSPSSGTATSETSTTASLMSKRKKRIKKL